MGWFDFARSSDSPVIETRDIPLFPLEAVLFPGGLLPLKIFEQRYLDMAAACLKDNKPFGICLIARGDETGKPAEPHGVGTLAEIGNCEMEQLGILQIIARGGRRFRIIEAHSRADHLLQGRVEIIPDNGPLAMPPERQRLLPLLRRVVSDLGRERIPEPHHFDDAEWVGYRITEVLPIQNLAKQKLLELEDPLARLEILEKFLDQRQLLG
ncbi:MAG: peptidase [Proteobacteria bacterium]|nr:peptidase [Pseudomonadota bacterium]